MSAAKYKLYKVDPTTGEAPPCAFFHSEKGCKNGDTCKFSHALPSDKQAAPAAVVYDDDSSDVVSSESEVETPQLVKKIAKKKEKAPVTPKQTPKQKPVQNDSAKSTETKKKRKRNKEESIDDSDLGLFTNPKRTSNSNKSNEKKEIELPPSPPKQATPKPSAKKAKTVQKTPDFRALDLPITSAKKEKPAVQKAPSFRALDLPIASFSTTDGTAITPKKEASTTTTSAKKSKSKKLPIPNSTPEGKKWQNAVLQTRANPKYSSVYDYAKIKATDEENGVAKSQDWFKALPFGEWCANNPHAIAIDCEMCETKDPVSGNSDSKALCRLSVVNAVNPEDVLIDTLVKPVWPVVDYRTRINGIKKEDLDNVEFTLDHAKAFMKALCSEETVIIGHALHNDLVSLKMEHHCNVDSAFLFSVKDAPSATCSLKDLAKTVMGKEMPNIHCSVNDARTALTCIDDGYLKTGGKPEEVVRTVKNNHRHELFIHRIPKGCKPEHIKNMFLAHTSIQPEDVPDIVFGVGTGKTTIAFKSPEHANLAFRSLDGEIKPDKTGRLQKRIYLRNRDYLYIRKMTMEKRRSSSGGSDE
jgi:RNA exonuclease 1